MTRVFALAALGLLACEPEAPPPVEPPPADEFRSERVAANLEQLSRAATTRGFVHESSEVRGFLVEGVHRVDGVSLRSGSCYLVVVTATPSVRELELVLFDGDGAEISRDHAQGPHAVLEHCPTSSGTYFAALRATAGHGLFAEATFRGPTGLPVHASDLLEGLAARGTTP